MVSPRLGLRNNRFGVQAVFRTEGGAVGDGIPVPLTSDTGYLWFFQSSNVEIVVKVLDGCGINNRYWVFAGGLTDVNVDLIVTDYATGLVRTYTNPQKTPFQPIQDTSAFATLQRRRRRSTAAGEARRMFRSRAVASSATPSSSTTTASR